MNEAIWILSIILGVLSLLICVKNAQIFIKREILKKKGPSMIPFVWAILGFFALRICPLHEIGRWAWVAFIFDMGTLGQAYYLLLIGLDWRGKRG